MIAPCEWLCARLRRVRDGGQTGASSVELAIIAPVFLLLSFGAFDLGLTVSLYNMTSEAARDGARAAQVMMGQGHAATLSASEVSQIVTAASNVTSPLAALGGGLTVTPSLEQDADGYWYVKVTATTAYQPVVSSFIRIGNTSVSATSRLAVPCGRC